MSYPARAEELGKYEKPPDTDSPSDGFGAEDIVTHLKANILIEAWIGKMIFDSNSKRKRNLFFFSNRSYFLGLAELKIMLI